MWIDSTLSACCQHAVVPKSTQLDPTCGWGNKEREAIRPLWLKEMQATENRKVVGLDYGRQFPVTTGNIIT
jgi:hypothetical protein